MSTKFKPPHIPLPEKSKKWNRPDMDGYVVFDSDIKRLEKKQARKLKIQKAKEL